MQEVMQEEGVRRISEHQSMFFREKTKREIKNTV